MRWWRRKRRGFPRGSDSASRLHRWEKRQNRLRVPQGLGEPEGNGQTPQLPHRGHEGSVVSHWSVLRGPAVHGQSGNGAGAGAGRVRPCSQPGVHRAAKWGRGIWVFLSLWRARGHPSSSSCQSRGSTGSPHPSRQHGRVLWVVAPTLGSSSAPLQALPALCWGADAALRSFPPPDPTGEKTGWESSTRQIRAGLREAGKSRSGEGDLQGRARQLPQQSGIYPSRWDKLHNSAALR